MIGQLGLQLPPRQVSYHNMPDGSLALETLPSITSDTDDFFGVLIWGIIGLVVFLLLIPSALLRALHRTRKRSQMWSSTIQAQYGSLFLRYRPGVSLLPNTVVCTAFSSLFC